jgi:multidrug efflux pump subunit AcrA (membrane-fusion protein)
MMQDIRIDGRMQRVFVLMERDDRVVYIPLTALTQVDYDRLIDISKQDPKNMLETMSKAMLSNGRNMLALYDTLIQVMVKTGDAEGTRVLKTTEREDAMSFTVTPLTSNEEEVDAKGEPTVEKPVEIQPKPDRKASYGRAKAQ